MKKISFNWDPNRNPEKDPWGNNSNKDNYSNQKNPNNDKTKG